MRPRRVCLIRHKQSLVTFIKPLNLGTADVQVDFTITVKMRNLRAAALASLIAVTVAFKDTSPYILFSNSEYVPVTPLTNSEADLETRLSSAFSPSNKQLQLGTEVAKTTKDFLVSCPSDTYIIIYQPTINAADLSEWKNAPNLRRAVSNKDVKARVVVPEVIDNLSPLELQNYIRSKCNGVVMKVDLSSMLRSSETIHSQSNNVQKSLSCLAETRPSLLSFV